MLHLTLHLILSYQLTKNLARKKKSIDLVDLFLLKNFASVQTIAQQEKHKFHFFITPGIPLRSLRPPFS